MIIALFMFFVVITSPLLIMVLSDSFINLKYSDDLYKYKVRFLECKNQVGGIMYMCEVRKNMIWRQIIVCDTLEECKDEYERYRTYSYSKKATREWRKKCDTITSKKIIK